MLFRDLGKRDRHADPVVVVLAGRENLLFRGKRVRDHFAARGLADRTRYAHSRYPVLHPLERACLLQGFHGLRDQNDRPVFKGLRDAACAQNAGYLKAGDQRRGGSGFKCFRNVQMSVGIAARDGCKQCAGACGPGIHGKKGDFSLRISGDQSASCRIQNVLNCDLDHEQILSI